uniref:BET1 protein n=1 Tax=Wuchereria bancrofti TaxID=6293 RepID=A0A1I8EHS7_WUCBA
MTYRGSSNGVNVMGENDEGIFMERRNDALVAKLSGKVAALKKITIAIGDDVREQNRLLNEMETDFDASKGLLGSTMRKLDRVAKAGGKHLTCYLVLFALFVFLIIYYLIHDVIFGHMLMFHGNCKQCRNRCDKDSFGSFNVKLP